jgi:hypothetical protein
MSDQHQVISIIATAIGDARKDHPDGGIDPEEAKQVAKCIIEALSDAGLRFEPPRWLARYLADGNPCNGDTVLRSSGMDGFSVKGIDQWEVGNRRTFSSASNIGHAVEQPP